MNTRTIAIAAIALWAVSAGVIGFKFMTGTTIEGTDGRQAIVLDPGERDFVLTEMRGFLASIQEMLVAINNNDMETVKTVAHRVGMAEVKAVPPQTMLKLPMEFKQMGMSTHRGFDEVVLAAEMGPEAALESLAANMENCVVCHEGWRLTAGK